MKFIFLHADKHESLQQIDTIIFDGDGQASIPKVSTTNFQCLYNILKKVSDEIVFLHGDEHQSFLQVDFDTWNIKVSYKVILSVLTGMIKHSESTQSNKLQYLYNISKKKLGMEFIFCMQIDKHQHLYKVALSFLMEVARHVQSTQSTSIVMQNIQIFYMSSHVPC